MPWYHIIWSDEAVAHLANNDVSPDQFEFVLTNAQRETVIRSTGNPAVVGQDQDGRLLFCVFKKLDDVTVTPVTAYEIDD